jgi:uroporphyrinogen-III synthase
LSSGAVVLTRQPQDNAALAAELRARDVDVIELPCIRIAPLADPAPLEREVASLRAHDTLVLTSPAGVDAVASLGRTVECGVAVIGQATALRARRAGMSVVFVAPHHTSAALGRSLPLPDGDVVLARSDLAHGELPRILRERGARVREVIAYRTVAEVSGDTTPLRQALTEGACTIVVLSPSAATALGRALDVAVLRAARFVAIGERTAERIRELIGVEPLIAATTHVRDIADAIAPQPTEVTT